MSGGVAPVVGDVIAERYRIVGVLGEGGMGAVYEAIQLDLHRPVALKVLHPGSLDRGDAVARFQREARVTAALHHPGAVKIFDFGRDGAGRLFLVMEKLRGTTLRSYVDEGRPLLPQGRIVDIARQIAEVLVASHAIGLVHRDLKPENVFLETNVDGSDRVVVVDFGLAYIEDRADVSRMTKEGMIAGTPAYMSPEQCSGKPTSTPADIYALGCMLYEMAVGVVPFEGAAFQLLVKHAYEEPQPPGQRRRDLYVPRALEELILEMLHKAPESRPKAEKVVERLGKIATTLGERERARGRELLEGRVARMIPTVRTPEDAHDEGMRPTALPEQSIPPSRTLAILGAVEADVLLGLRTNGLAPLETSEVPQASQTIAIFAPGASEERLRALLAVGVPVLTDAGEDEPERVTKMVAIGVADVVTRPVRADTLATKVHRAVKKAARRAR